MEMQSGQGHGSTLPPTIYIVGAQCTGKTTLVDALGKYFRIPENRNWNGEPIPEPFAIKEVARNVLREHKYTAFDITSSPKRALELQKLILEAQYRAEEEAAAAGGWYISDRSAIDPFVHARVFAGETAAHEMLQTETWSRLGEKMRKGLVFVCEPNRAWLVDDGVRLVSKDWEEWTGLHRVFCQSLEEHAIDFEVLSGKLSVAGRVNLAIQSLFQLKRTELDTAMQEKL